MDKIGDNGITHLETPAQACQASMRSIIALEHREERLWNIVGVELALYFHYGVRYCIFEHYTSLTENGG